MNVRSNLHSLAAMVMVAAVVTASPCHARGNHTFGNHGPFDLCSIRDGQDCSGQDSFSYCYADDGRLCLMVCRSWHDLHGNGESLWDVTDQCTAPTPRPLVSY